MDEETVTLPKSALDEMLRVIANYEKAMKIKHEKGIETEHKKHKKEKYFVKAYKGSGREIRRGKLLTKSEKALLFDIEVFINFETNIIVNESGIPMKQEAIGNLCGLRRSQVSEILTGLVDKGILFEVKDGKYKYYRVSTDYYECGNWDKEKFESAFLQSQSAICEMKKHL